MKIITFPHQTVLPKDTLMLTISDTNHIHCVKSVRIRSYSGLHFPAFELNMERYSVSLRIQSECGKIRTRATPNTDTFIYRFTRVNLQSKSYKSDLTKIFGKSFDFYSILIFL